MGKRKEKKGNSIPVAVIEVRLIIVPHKSTIFRGRDDKYSYYI
jgi:hypothetical protein